MQTQTPIADSLLDLEMIVLESLLNDECKCEFKHHWTMCSKKVTHNLIWCKGSVKICFNAYQSRVNDLDDKMTCVDCKKHAKDCWRFVPI